MRTSQRDFDGPETRTKASKRNFVCSNDPYQTGGDTEGQNHMTLVDGTKTKLL